MTINIWYFARKSLGKCLCANLIFPNWRLLRVGIRMEEDHLESDAMSNYTSVYMTRGIIPLFFEERVLFSHNADITI